jgi:hypothetical protein
MPNPAVSAEAVADTDAASEAKDTAAMEAEIAEKMNKAFGEEPTPEATDEPTPEATDEPTPEAEDGEPAGEAGDEPAGEAEGEPAGYEPNDENALTPAEIRAAKYAGWSDEDLGGLAKANPGMAKRAGQAALKAMNTATTVLSRIGNKPVDETAAPSASAPGKGVDLSALEADYGDDPILPVLKQLAEQNAALAAQIAQTGANYNEDVIGAAEQQEQDAIEQQITGFFNSPDVLTYADTYGDATKDESWDTLTQSQVRARMRVIEDANLIVKGAKQQGIDMPLSEAFERAHLVAVAPLQEQRIRNKIASTATKRAKGFTLKPSYAAKPVGGKPTQSQIEADIKHKMAAVFS